MHALTFLLERVPSPLGEMLIVTDEDGVLRALDWHDHEDRMHELMRRQYPGGQPKLRDTAQRSTATLAMRAYFEGDIAAIHPLKVATGGTPFQRQIWTALRGIPDGETISYGELAQRIGKPAAVRAVGLANGANPVSIVLPCHRVIGSNHSLTGYGGGLARKQWLLRHENALPFEQAKKASSTAGSLVTEASTMPLPGF